jgi:hypothetical protein
MLAGMKEMALAVAATISLCAAQRDAAAEAPRRFALLVGCTTYPWLDPRLHLRGPANDARLLAAVLQRHLDVPAANIAILAGWDEQDPASRPTRANILEQLARLARPGGVRAGDQVIVLLAGHGARQPDIDGDELDGLDEIFLPADVRDWREEIQTVENAIVDDERGRCAGAIRDAGARVWLLIDSCFSGTMLRSGDGEARERFVPPQALRIPAQTAGTPGADASDRGSLPLADTRGIVALYASRSYHVAGERRLPAGDPDREWHGVLTFLTARCLAHVGATTTFETLYHQLVAAYPEVWQGTLPLAEGELALRVRGEGAQEGPQLHACQDGAQLAIDGGTLHDVCAGAILAVYRPGQRGLDSGLLGHAEVTKVQLARSWARARPDAQRPLPRLEGELQLCPAEIVETPVASVALNVTFVDAAGGQLASLPDDVAATLASEKRLRACEGSGADVRVTLEAEHASVAVLDSGAARTYRVPRAQLAATLLQIHRATNLIRLARAAGSGGGDVHGIETGLHEGERALQPGDSLRPGSAVALRVRNASGDEREAWVFLIDADYGIQELFPSGRPALLAPDETRPFSLGFTATDTTLGTEHLLTLVLPKGSGSLAWLGQTPLRTRGSSSSDLAGALEDLMFGTRGVSVRVDRRRDVHIGLRSWQTTWGAVRAPAWPHAPLALPPPRAAVAPDGPLPDPWALRRVAALRDPASGRADALLGGDELPRTVLLDLDGGCDLPDEDPAALQALADPRRFDAELALVFEPQRRIAFYDRDDDGAFDLALIDDDGDALADAELERNAGNWVASTAAGSPWLRVRNLDQLLRARDPSFETRALARVSSVLR